MFALLIRTLVTLVFIFYLGLPGVLAQTDTLRIATYNILKFPTNFGTQRLPHFVKVIRALEPDILVVEELESSQGLDLLKQNVLDVLWPGQFSTAPFFDGPDTDCGLFFRNDIFELKAARPIPTDLRNIYEYILQAGELRLFLYAAHFKAGSDYETMRLNEATALRNRLNILPKDSYVIVVGDLNLYSSSEPAYVKLTENQATNSAELYDPIQRPGNWHNNRSFAMIHTQSTRTVALSDEGSSGGLDDRFDFILGNANVLDSEGIEILSDTYKAFGNDGRHFNDAVNNYFNSAVPDSIADALYYASDHLPVVVDVVLHHTVAVKENEAPPSDFRLEVCYPTPMRTETKIPFNAGKTGTVTLTIYNLRGYPVWRKKVELQHPGFSIVPWYGKDLRGAAVAGGIYFLKAQFGKESQTQKIIVVR